MPVIVFIVDNSASMNQKTYLGTSYLDVAKSAIENFLKIRSRDQINGRNDRYMLLTLDEPPSNIKVGWKENMSIFNNELKNLKANGLTNLGPVLKQSFDLLNLNRLFTGMDTYGLGRCPFYLEPSLLILITDSGCLCNANMVCDELTLPLTNSPLGSELTIEPFRWDQRFFSINLSMQSFSFNEQNTNGFIPYATNSPVNIMCDVTGGRSYLISSQRALMQCLESLVSKIQPGVVINLEKFGADPLPSGNESDVRCVSGWDKCRKMIYVQKTSNKTYASGHWPIPEEYWVSTSLNTLAPRSAHPLVKFKCDAVEPLSIDEIPFDKYELEPSPLTQFILERRQANVAWQVYVPNSHKLNELGAPFGYLKASTNLMCVNLFVMPYNYPLFLQLMSELFQQLKLKPNKHWQDRFDTYLKSIPVYYYAPLRRVLSKKGLQHLIPETLENCLSPQVQSYLKKVKNQAKSQFDQVCAHPTLKVDYMPLLKRNESLNENKDFQAWLDRIEPSKAEFMKSQINDFNGFQMYIREGKFNGWSRNPGDIPRENLIETLQKMRLNFFDLNKHPDPDEAHSISIHDMGNYHDYLKNQAPPLRDLETQLVRQHMFGNPFKLVSKEQKQSLFGGADEIDELNEEANQHVVPKRANSEFTTRGPSGKRRVKGPLSKRISYLRRSSTSTLESDVEFTTSDDETLSDTQSIASSTKEDIIQINESKLIISDIANLSDFTRDTPMEIVLTELSVKHEQHLIDSYLHQDYIHTKRACVREIRNSRSKLIGKTLEQSLACAKFTLKLKQFLVQELIYEASRFKRNDLMHFLNNLNLM